MGSFYINSEFYHHPKVHAVTDNAAFGLYVIAAAWSGRAGHPGYVPMRALRELARGATEGEMLRLAGLLTDAGLWNRIDGEGWEFHPDDGLIVWEVQ